MTSLQNKPIIVGSPIEIEFAVNEIRKVLAGLTWISHPYFIAQRFFKTKEGSNNYFPETYAPKKSGSRNYHRLTPDNDQTGMCFFMVGDGVNDFQPDSENFLTHTVGIIFSVNLEKIDPVKLEDGLFTQELISEARRLLTKTTKNHAFQYRITGETRDINQVYREFTLKDLDTYNRAPQQCFRIDMTVTVEESCN